MPVDRRDSTGSGHYNATAAMVVARTLLTRPCPRCQAAVRDTDPRGPTLVRCGACGHEVHRAAFAAADPAFSESVSADATMQPASARVAETTPGTPASQVTRDGLPMSPEFREKFQILATLGAGGMGVVYLARQIRLERLVAIKAIKGARTTGKFPASGSSSLGSARFSREAIALARLSHPNVLAIHEAGEDGGTPFIVFEYIEGMNLKQLIQNESPLSIGRCVDLTRQLLAGLEHAHSRGVVHRDLKPENILLPVTGGLKIADFGLARLAGPTTEKLTATGMVMGTPCYMSPEQVQGARVTIASDIYAVGIILYELLSGTVPFTAPSVPELLVKHVREPVPDPRARRAEVPPALAVITLRALGKEPASRWESAAAFAKALEAVPRPA